MTQINPKDNVRMSSRKMGKPGLLEPPLVGRIFSPPGMEIPPDEARQKRAGRNSALSSARTCKGPVSLDPALWD